MTDSIWTLEARDSVLLEVMASYFDLSDEVVRNEIWGARQFTVDALEMKGISYKDLRNALVPQQDRHELALLFDSARVDSNWYGYPVAETLIPKLPRNLLCAFLAGDLLIDDADVGFELLAKHVVAHRPVELSHPSQLYCVYVNNLSPSMARDITSELQDFEPFVGYVDASTGSPIKDWLSITLVTSYLKARNVVLTDHEDDLPDTHDQNTQGWPWEKSGYPCRSIPSTYFDLFLGYKIERRVVPGFESDTRFALTAISGKPRPLEGVPVAVEQAKGEYLRTEKGQILARAGLDQLSDQELSDVIKAKISESYIYNLRYREATSTSLFNIMLEVGQADSGRVTRLLAAVEYEPETPVLRLVTLY